MTDTILNAALIGVIAACLAYGLFLRSRTLRAARRRAKPGAFNPANRFTMAVRSEDLPSLN